MAWVHMQKYVQWTEKFFYEILEPEIRAEDPDTPYTPGSPVGIAHNEGVYSDNVGDTHLWGVWRLAAYAVLPQTNDPLLQRIRF